MCSSPGGKGWTNTWYTQSSKSQHFRKSTDIKQPEGGDQLWKLFQEERRKNTLLQLENEMLKKSLNVYKKSLEIKTAEIDSKNKLINKLIVERTDVELSYDMDDVNIEQLLQANLGGGMMTDLLDNLGDLDGLNFEMSANNSGNLEEKGEEKSTLEEVEEKESIGETTPKTKSNVVRQVSSQKTVVRPPVGVKQGPGSRSALQCPHCSRQFPRGGAWKLSRHIESAHPGVATSVECNLCGKIFSSNSTLIAHRASHRSLHPFQCGACNLPLQNMLQFKQHVMEDHGVLSLSRAKELLGVSE